MKIIKASYEILTPISDGGKTELKFIEKCGRVCYKSEDKITDGSAEKFVKMLIDKGHESVIEHSILTVKFICDRATSHELVRHRLASFCVTGDTILHSIGQKEWSVKQLYEWQSDYKRKGRLKLIKIRSVDTYNHVIVPNTINKIYDMGVKNVYEITTENGRKLRCTLDHLIYTPQGFKKLRDIKINDYIYGNGLELLENKDWLNHYYIELNHSRKETAEFIGCCESYVYKAFKKFDIKKDRSQYPNRKAGYGKKGMFSDEALKKISESKKGANNHWYKKDRDLLSINGGYCEARRNFKKEECANCKSIKNLEIHHIDRNPKNNSENNITILCSKCHHLQHRHWGLGIVKDKVISIEYIGKERVYDISMNTEPYNFIANSIVIHNCQESQRYCNYSDNKFNNEVTFIEPCYFNKSELPYSYWLSLMSETETMYIDLLDYGIKPEEARAVLPNSTKTEIVITANYRQWRNILKQRTAKAASPQIRELMIPLLKELKSKIHVVFDDIEVIE